MCNTSTPGLHYMTKMISARPASALRLEVAFCVIPKLVVNYFSARGYGEKPEESEGANRVKDSVDKLCYQNSTPHFVQSWQQSVVSYSASVNSEIMSICPCFVFYSPTIIQYRESNKFMFPFPCFLKLIMGESKQRDCVSKTRNMILPQFQICV